jgi:methyl-accepting chemotaxis protein
MATKKPAVKPATKKATVKKPVAKIKAPVKKPVAKKATAKKVVKKAQPVVAAEQELDFKPMSSFLSMHAGMDPEAQAHLIAEQTRRAFDVEAYVQFNVAQTQVARSIVEENVTDAMQSWAINAGGNREMIMRTTDDVYRNRLMMLNLLAPANPVEAAFQESMINKTKLEYLQHRNVMNRRMVDIAQDMATAIKAIGAASEKFYHANEEMVAFIDDVANENAEWFDGELKTMMREATNITNDQRIQQAMEVSQLLAKDAQVGRHRIREVSEFAQGLGDSLQELQESGNELRDDVINIREKIDASQRRIADTIIKRV